jgi:hypothetical protein
VEFRAVVICSKCQRPIVSGEGFGFVCFKIPGQQGYHFFHCRFRSRDCWGVYINGEATKVGTAQSAAPVVNWP